MLQHKVERGSVQQIYGKELSRCMFEKRSTFWMLRGAAGQIFCKWTREDVTRIASGKLIDASGLFLRKEDRIPAAN